MRRCEEETQVPKVARHYFDKNNDNRDNCKDDDDEYRHNFDDNRDNCKDYDDEYRHNFDDNRDNWKDDAVRDKVDIRR